MDQVRRTASARRRPRALAAVLAAAWATKVHGLGDFTPVPLQQYEAWLGSGQRLDEVNGDVLHSCTVTLVAAEWAMMAPDCATKVQEAQFGQHELVRGGDLSTAVPPVGGERRNFTGVFATAPDGAFVLGQLDAPLDDFPLVQLALPPATLTGEKAALVGWSHKSIEGEPAAVEPPAVDMGAPRYGVLDFGTRESCAGTVVDLESYDAAQAWSFCMELINRPGVTKENHGPSCHGQVGGPVVRLNETGGVLQVGVGHFGVGCGAQYYAASGAVFSESHLLFVQQTTGRALLPPSALPTEAPVASPQLPPLPDGPSAGGGGGNGDSPVAPGQGSPGDLEDVDDGAAVDGTIILAAAGSGLVVLAGFAALAARRRSKRRQGRGVIVAQELRKASGTIGGGGASSGDTGREQGAVYGVSAPPFRAEARMPENWRPVSEAPQLAQAESASQVEEAQKKRKKKKKARKEPEQEEQQRRQQQQTPLARTRDAARESVLDKRISRII